MKTFLDALPILALLCTAISAFWFGRDYGYAQGKKETKVIYKVAEAKTENGWTRFTFSDPKPVLKAGEDVGIELYWFD